MDALRTLCNKRYNVFITCVNMLTTIHNLINQQRIVSSEFLYDSVGRVKTQVNRELTRLKEKLDALRMNVRTTEGYNDAIAINKESNGKWFDLDCVNNLVDGTDERVLNTYIFNAAKALERQRAKMNPGYDGGNKLRRHGRRR